MQLLSHQDFYGLCACAALLEGNLFHLIKRGLEGDLLDINYTNGTCNKRKN